jgi:hypothetical protein
LCRHARLFVDIDAARAFRSTEGRYMRRNVTLTVAARAAPSPPYQPQLT